jgi:hypothetical protein
VIIFIIVIIIIIITSIIFIIVILDWVSFLSLPQFIWIKGFAVVVVVVVVVLSQDSSLNQRHDKRVHAT